MEDCFIFWSVGWLVLSPRNSIHLCVLLCRVLVVVLVLLLNYIILLLCDSRWLWSACFRSVCVFVLCTPSRFISNRQLIHQVHSKSEREDIPATIIIIILIVREDQDKFFCFNTGEEEDDHSCPGTQCLSSSARAADLPIGASQIKVNSVHSCCCNVVQEAS